MNILIVGNGFDLAHGLPTRYSDYVHQISEELDFKQYLGERYEIDEESYQLFIRVKKSTLFRYIEHRCEDGWVDFENELRLIVDDTSDFEKHLSRQSKKADDGLYNELLFWDSRVVKVKSSFLQMTLDSNGKGPWAGNEFNHVEDTIIQQIFDFISLFKKYIVWVNTVELPKKSPISLIDEIKIDHFLSFNYTPTFLKLYSSASALSQKNICYVHGRLDEDSNAPIVMGVGSDFYNADLNEYFLKTFKFYQRYKYCTDLNFLNWFKEIRVEYSWAPSSQADEEFNVYIYGHSLDPTDKDILLPFFETENANIVVYYFDENSRFSLEKNLLKILGQDTFCKYLIAQNPKIRFEKM